MRSIFLFSLKYETPDLSNGWYQSSLTGGGGGEGLNLYVKVPTTGIYWSIKRKINVNNPVKRDPSFLDDPTILSNYQFLSETFGHLDPTSSYGDNGTRVTVI